MKWFNFSWFRSPEREALDKLKVKEQELTNGIFQKRLDKMSVQVTWKPPYKKLLYTNGKITVVMEGGVVINAVGDGELFQKVKDAYTEDQVRTLLIPVPEVKETIKEEYTQEEIAFVQDNLSIIKKHQDFEQIGDDIFLKGVALPLVPIVLASFIEILEKKAAIPLFSIDSIGETQKLVVLQEQFEALKMFWRWTALNPIESSRRDLLSFVKNNDISITLNGMLELYRRVVNVGSTDKALVTFVGEQYFKVKKNKKSPKNYFVWLKDDGSYLLSTDDRPSGIEKIEGNLAELYTSLNTMAENIYTDAHTRTKIIKIGEVYREDEDKIDLDNSRSCSAGLHVGSRSFMFNGFGDTGVLALVNPSKVRSVPNHECNKMRVSEMFIVGAVDLGEYSSHVDSGDLADYSQEYFNASVEELEQQLKDKTFEKLSCQENVPVVSISNIIDIKNALKERIVTI